MAARNQWFVFITLIHRGSLWIKGKTKILFSKFLNIPQLPKDWAFTPYDERAQTEQLKLPPHVEDIKKAGNEFLTEKKFLPAIYQYNQAINIAPQYPVLYLNRATTLMRRNWYGDAYAAMKDCQTAIRLEPRYVKAYIRLTRILLELGMVDDALQCLNELTNRYPDLKSHVSVLALIKDIQVRRCAKMFLRLCASYGWWFFRP